MRNKKWWVIGAVALIAGFFIWRGTRAKETGPVFRAAQVSRTDVRVAILATGLVQPQNRLEIKPPIAGRAETIAVREGQAVKKGQVLAWMSSTERAALLDAARAKGAEELAHWEDLYKPTPLVAPLNGVVIHRNVEPGQTVTSADPVIVMSDRLIVKAQVDETDIARVKLGQAARITLDAYPDQPIAAQVGHIAFEAKTVNNVTVYEVEVVPAKVPDAMRSGMTANVNFLVQEAKDALTVPAEAVREVKGEKRVFVPAGKKREARAVETGLSDGKNVVILSGLAEGDAILVPTVTLPGKSGGQARNPFAPGGAQQRRSR